MAVLKATTCKEAISRWEKAKGQVAADALVVELQFMYPPIEKMDGALSTLETVSDTLEELWVSYNNIDKMKGIGTLKNLRVLYMCNNSVKEWVEFNRLQECPALRDLVFIGNPICDNQPDIETWRTQVANRLTQIIKLDGIPIIREG
ncbi:putative dynein light chain [Operophtera brumata]|uniref:Putative dynein light chain n=1 Tax=Operophtera brumata TaxID=104452 RepID=A0A0L7L9B6_OPEBR|nr:putative dynein light chain [Operophtera brumata]